MEVELRQLFRQHGFAPVKAELWSEFVQQVLVVLREAADELRRPENWKAFQQKRGALSVPRKSCRQGVSQRVPIEDAITSELGHLVRRLRRSLPVGHFLRLNEVEFRVEDQVPSESRAGRHSKKVDFFVCSSIGLEAPEFAIEAKPIAKEADIVDRYLAEDGIGCFFSTDSPYTRGPLGGMLAYTINGVARSWNTEVSEAVRVYVPKPLGIDATRVEGEPLPLMCSRHERSALSIDPIAIFHLEMIFAPEEVAEASP